jgi:hypothetical protein
MSKLQERIISDEEFVRCRICMAPLQIIDGRHTKKVHKMSFEEYLEKYPNEPTITRERLNYMEEKIKKSIEKHNKLKNKTKIVTCSNPKCTNEQKEFKVNINVTNKFYICEECKKKGIKRENQDQINQNRKNTFLKKYGVEHQRQIKSVNEKIKKTNEEKYGGTGFASEELRNKVNAYFGGLNYQQTEEGKNKLRNRRYPERSEETRRKMSEVKKGKKNPHKGKTLEEIHGKEKAKKLRQIALEPYLPQLKKDLKFLNLELLDEEYINTNHKHNWKCKICGEEFQHQLGKIKFNGYTCPGCYPRNPGTSIAEQQILEHLQKVLPDIEIKNNVRNILSNPNYELDIFIPSKNIAIEYNGLYWHIDEHRQDKNYHLEKTKLCAEKGITLIHIFEDEWIYKKKIVKSRINQLLNISNDNITIINARNCEIKEIDFAIKNQFLIKNHIQGRDNSSIRLGAFHNNKLVSVMTFSKPSIAKGIVNQNNNIWELNRFCSKINYRVRGIAGKLLKYFQRNYPWKEIYSYADRRWSIGNLYSQLGFTQISETKPNYWYVDLNKIKRIHRFNLRKRKDEPRNISEITLRISEGYKIIWDCGSLKFQIKNE